MNLHGVSTVNAETAFKSQIAKVKRRVILLAVYKFVLNTALIFLCISIFALVVTTAEITNYQINRSLIFVTIGVSLSVALFISFITRKKFLKVLVEIDRRFKLQDKLSTAYEYLELNKKSDFKELLMKDAADSLHQLSGINLLPVRFSYAHAGVIILFIANVVLYWLISPASQLQATRGGQEIFENAAKLIKKYTIRRIENKSDLKGGPQPSDADNLERLSKALKDNSKTDAQRYEALKNVLEDLQAEQIRQEDELSTRLNAAEIGGFANRKIPQLKNLSLEQLEKIKTLLNQTANQQNSDAIDTSIESLQELKRLEKLIARMINDLEQGKTRAAESLAPAGNEAQSSSFDSRLENKRDDNNRAHSKEMFSSGGRIGNDAAAQPGSEQSGGDKDGSQEEIGPPDGYSSAAGNAEAVEQDQPSYTIEKSQGARLRDKMTTARTQKYLIHIRALTDIGEARQKEEEIIRTYHKEIESLLQKEDIPLNYREYIKNYFISIGMSTEENANEFD